MGRGMTPELCFSVSIRKRNTDKLSLEHEVATCATASISASYDRNCPLQQQFGPKLKGWENPQRFQMLFSVHFKKVKHVMKQINLFALEVTKSGMSDGGIFSSRYLIGQSSWPCLRCLWLSGVTKISLLSNLKIPFQVFTGSIHLSLPSRAVASC